MPGAEGGGASEKLRQLDLRRGWAQDKCLEEKGWGGVAGSQASCFPFQMLVGKGAQGL